MNYSEIAGQSDLIKQLLGMAQQKQLPHALFISGDDGIGALPLAHALARHILCEQPNANGACELCAACKKSKSWSHPDLHPVFPIIKSKEVKQSNDERQEFRQAYSKNPYLLLDDWLSHIEGEHKQPIIPVDEAETILHNLSLTSFEGLAKIVLVWHPAYMNTETANKLLKVIEEPPENTYFIFTTGGAEELLPTLVSRLQTWTCTPVTEIQLKGIKPLCEWSETVVQQVISMSQGNPGLAIQIGSQPELRGELLEDFQQFMRHAIRFQASTGFLCIEQLVAKGRSYQKRFLLYSLYLLRQALLTRENIPMLPVYNYEEDNFIKKFAPFVSLQACEILSEVFSLQVYYIERNANPKILFTDLLFTCSEYLKK